MNRSMKYAAILMGIGALHFQLVAQTDSAGAAPEEKPALELGGLVTLDYWADIARMNKPELTVGQVELGANVFVSEEVTATVVLDAWNKMDSIWIDQAVTCWKPTGKPLTFLGGKHTLYHGLGTTRLINYPDIYYSVIMKKPALTTLFSAGMATFGVAPTVLYFDFDSLANLEASSSYAGVINCDLALPNESLLRLASLISTELVDVDLAVDLAIGPFNIDVEALSRWSLADRALGESGYYVGLAYTPVERLTLAVRNDGTSAGIFSDLTQRVTGGLTFTMKDDIFCAVEYSYCKPSGQDAGQTIALEFGLESTLKLPGFRPKSLVNRE
jgi:hypothetical protein